MKASEQLMGVERPRVFITITRSFLTRNILRSGVLQGLVARGFDVDVFFSADSIPPYIMEEFTNPHVALYSFTLPPPSPVHRRINKVKRLLIDTLMSRQTVKFESKPKVKVVNGAIRAEGMSALRVVWNTFLLSVLSRTPPIKPLLRFLEMHVFTERHEVVEKYFDTLEPHAVFTTSIVSNFDIVFLKSAKRRGVPTVSQPKGWDNVTKEYYPVVPDVFLVPSPTAKREADRLQGMKAEQTVAVGMPQFDWYAKKDAELSRIEHFKAKGLDPEKALIFFGSEGAWAANEVHIAERLLEWVKNGELAKPAQLLVRPHFSNITKDVFAEFRGKPNVVVDSYRIVDFLLEKWDPSVEETIDFVNSIRHSEIIINIASTLSLDGAALDRPVIEIAFGCEYIGDKDVTEEKLYSTDHMQWLAKLDGTVKVRSYEELKKALNDYLVNPALKAEGRKRIRDELTLAIDGKSSERIVNEIVKASKTYGK